MAFGVDEPRHIIVHQVNVDKCPHIDTVDGGQCGIYQRRPLICRAFPYTEFSSFSGIAKASPECPEIESQLKTGALRPVLCSKTEIEACTELELYHWDMFLEYMPARGKMWIFDLAQKGWKECAPGTHPFAYRSYS
jgi:hypothetical protein